MKKLMTLMLGTGLALGTITVTFGQDQPKDGTTTKKKGKKKKSTDEPKQNLR